MLWVWPTRGQLRVRPGCRGGEAVIAQRSFNFNISEWMWNYSWGLENKIPRFTWYQNMINNKISSEASPAIEYLQFCCYWAFWTYFLCISPQPHNTWVMSCVRCHELREQARAGHLLSVTGTGHWGAGSAGSSSQHSSSGDSSLGCPITSTTYLSRRNMCRVFGFNPLSWRLLTIFWSSLWC